MTIYSETLVIGSGPCASHVADNLAEQGIGVTWVTGNVTDAVNTIALQPPARVNRVQGSALVGCQGQAGSFRIILDQGGVRTAHGVASIIVAEEALYLPNFSEYGLQASRRVVTLSAIEAKARDVALESLIPPEARVVFLNGWRRDSHPAIAARMLAFCLRLQKISTARTVFMTGNLKVSMDHMEACCQAAKAAGAIFVKFGDRVPRMAMLDDTRVQIDYHDETSGMDFRVSADLVIVDETVHAHPSLAGIAEILRLERDATGFLQADNVHRLSNSTNRRGVFVAGGSRAVAGAEQQKADAGQVALQVVEFLAGRDRESLRTVDIDQGRCARCLTCYRLCPYMAIDISPRMTVVAQACQSCGLCAAGCPNQAIRMSDAGVPEAIEALSRIEGNPARSVPFTPRLAIFGCNRSAALAREAAFALGHKLSAGVTFVEGLCGGSFSVNHLLKAFEADADGVLLLSCHEGNCHSGTGTSHARKRCAEAAKALSWAGVEPQRIHYGTLSASMGCEFVQVVDDFVTRIAALGPLTR
ncbi:MAG: hypothetical protein VR64_16540 [Desulfatitalea sp. BRH_c12]|nr:MAG: hypothetical protein VR64_16540 [Desulfatitalea sp. BRH_c12]